MFSLPGQKRGSQRVLGGTGPPSSAASIWEGLKPKAQVGSRFRGVLEARVVGGGSPVLIFYRTELSQSLNPLEESLLLFCLQMRKLRHGAVHPPGLSSTGPLGRRGLPFVVTGRAPCPRPQVTVQRQKALGHSQVHACHQGSSWGLPRSRAPLLQLGQGPGPPRREPGRGSSRRQSGPEAAYGSRTARPCWEDSTNPSYPF